MDTQPLGRSPSIDSAVSLDSFKSQKSLNSFKPQKSLRPSNTDETPKAPQTLEAPIVVVLAPDAHAARTAPCSSNAARRCLPTTRTNCSINCSINCNTTTTTNTPTNGTSNGTSNHNTTSNGTTIISNQKTTTTTTTTCDVLPAPSSPLLPPLSPLSILPALNPCPTQPTPLIISINPETPETPDVPETPHVPETTPIPNSNPLPPVARADIMLDSFSIARPGSGAWTPLGDDQDPWLAPNGTAYPDSSIPNGATGRNGSNDAPAWTPFHNWDESARDWAARRGPQRIGSGSSSSSPFLPFQRRRRPWSRSCCQRTLLFAAIGIFISLFTTIAIVYKIHHAASPLAFDGSSGPRGAVPGLPPGPPLPVLGILSLGTPTGSPGVYFGASIDWSIDDPDNFNSDLGHAAAIQDAFFYINENGLVTSALVNSSGVMHTIPDIFAWTAALIRGTGAIMGVSVIPTVPLPAISDQALSDLVKSCVSINNFGVPILLRFAPQMNGNWLPYGQDPINYRSKFQKLAHLVHNATNQTAMVWSPASSLGYPYPGGTYAPIPNTAGFRELDTNNDGRLTPEDDPYLPFYPGDDVVDWIGLSIFYTSPSPDLSFSPLPSKMAFPFPKSPVLNSSMGLTQSLDDANVMIQSDGSHRFTYYRDQTRSGRKTTINGNDDGERVTRSGSATVQDVTRSQPTVMPNAVQTSVVSGNDVPPTLFDSGGSSWSDVVRAQKRESDNSTTVTTTVVDDVLLPPTSAGSGMQPLTNLKLKIPNYNNTIPPAFRSNPDPTSFFNQLTGAGTSFNFYDLYARKRMRPLLLTETGAAFYPYGSMTTPTTTELSIKQTWMQQIFNAATLRSFPLIRGVVVYNQRLMLNTTSRWLGSTPVSGLTRMPVVDFGVTANTAVLQVFQQSLVPLILSVNASDLVGTTVLRDVSRGVLKFDSRVQTGTASITSGVVTATTTTTSLTQSVSPSPSHTPLTPPLSNVTTTGFLIFANGTATVINGTWILVNPQIRVTTTMSTTSSVTVTTTMTVSRSLGVKGTRVPSAP